MGSTTITKKEWNWGPALIHRLRGKRTQAEFGALAGVPKNTVWRWEAGRAKPDAAHARRLSKLAERERFLENWKLVGSVWAIGDIEEGSREIARLAEESLERSARQLAGDE